MNELDKLRPEVRDAIEVMDRLNTVTGSWNLLRADLLRVYAVNVELREQLEYAGRLFDTAQSERERAEAELAALKARFAAAPIAAVSPSGTTNVMAAVPRGWAGKRVRLVLED